jgi:hypothetical protein
MIVSREIRFKSFSAIIAVTHAETIDYSRSSIFTRTAVWINNGKSAFSPTVSRSPPG